MAWIAETDPPFSVTYVLGFSTIENGEVYAIDRGTNFYLYSLTTGVWTKKADPVGPSSGNRCILVRRAGKIYTARENILQRTKIGIYDPVGDSWSYSASCPAGYYLQSICFEDDDTIWAFAPKTTENGVKCLKYTISTDTWTEYTNSYSYAWPETYLFCDGYYGGAVFCGPCETSGSANRYLKYTIATDSYEISANRAGTIYCCCQSSNKLWYYMNSTKRYGYLDLSDESFHTNVYPANEDASQWYWAGVRNDLLRIIAHAKFTPAEGEVMSYSGITSPSVTTNPATSVESNSATLNGTLDDDGGEACDCGFEWGETIAYGNITPTQSRTTGQTFAQTITGLDPNKTYHFRAVATNSAGTSYGADRTFKTLVAIPTVTTDPATGLGAVLATLNGTLDSDGGEACNCGFEWGLDTGYGVTTPTQSKITGETFSQVIHGLSPGTVYHFRAFATNSVGTSYGADRTFTTALVVSRAFALAREEL